MGIKNLKIIGESINDSVPYTNKLFKENDIYGIKNLAKLQDENGASYIDVNVGMRSPEFMADLIKEIQSITTKPLSIDTPDFTTAKAGLEAYDIDKSNGKIPILNSISPLRINMFELHEIKPFMPILMVSERLENGQSKPNHDAENTLKTAQEMINTIEKAGYKIPIENCIFDVGIAPIASDSEGTTKRALDSIKLIHENPKLNKAHMSIGLSNFTVMLPRKCKDGMPVRSSLESALLTIATKYGFDMAIGSVKRNYKILDEKHPAMVCLHDILKLKGFDIIMRVQKFYS
ncbi:MAG: dihydropteroate synthase [Desulfobacterales bacterium]|nr:dihydropteroate synthase [Desulfobacterales bacterium]